MQEATEMQPYIPATAPKLEETGPTRHPTRAQAYLLFVSVLVINALGQTILGTFGLPFPLSVTISEVLFILVPVIAFLIIGNFDPRATLHLNPTTPRMLLLSALVALLAWPAAELLGMLTENILRNIGPLPQLVPPPTSGLEAIADFFALTLVPGICEETLNRGVMQRAFERQGLWRTVFYIAIFFSLFHLALYSALFTFMLGGVLAYVVYKTNSIYNSMVCHAVFNSVTATLIVLSYFKVIGNDVEDPSWLLPLAIVATPLLLLLLRYIGRTSDDTKAEAYVAPVDNSLVRGRLNFAELSLLTIIVVIFVVLSMAELLLRYGCEHPDLFRSVGKLCSQ